ncbi:MAG: hypothetical protein IT314_12030 [Anaerolineales bacterium]|nr:hypothetical protein [Anaerolineales bacterium]
MNKKTKPSEKEIDRIVKSQANDDSAWSKSIHVRRKRSARVSIPPKLAARAAFLAQIHKKKSVEEWLTRVIEERIELEEAAFVGAKEDLSAKVG